MGRRPCCDKVGLKRGPWTIEEDHKLIDFILNNGIHCWRTVPKLADLLRCGKSCRLRWINYLRPDLKRGDFTEAEEDQIIQLHSRLGNKWSKIASNFPGRTDNEIKNHWNTRIKKRLKQIGLDPLTHKPVQEAEQSDDKNRTNTEPNSSELTLKTVENNLDSNKEVVESEVQTLDQTSDIFDNNYDLLWGSLDNNIGLNTCTSSYSSSFSADESATVNDETQNSLQQQQWVEGVDSILSWDLFHHLEEDLFFLMNTQ